MSTVIAISMTSPQKNARSTKLDQKVADGIQLCTIIKSESVLVMVIVLLRQL
jgi:hypothetical protein